MTDENVSWEELRERIQRLDAEGDMRGAFEDAKGRIPLEKQRIEAMVEATISDHVDEQHLRQAVAVGAQPAVRVSDENPELLEVFLVHPDQDPLGPLGSFPISAVMVSEN